MSHAMLTLPAAAELSKELVKPVTELSKIPNVYIEQDAETRRAKIMVLIEAIKAFPDAFRSYNELQSVREEWEGRIKEAEIAVKKAEVDLKMAQEKNKPLMKKLELSREALMSLLLVFDGFYKQVMDADLSEDDRKEARQSLLQLSDQIVQIVRLDNSDATK